MATKNVTVALSDEEQALLRERIEYLQQQRKGTKVTQADAIRHAIWQTNYKRGKSNSSDE